MEARTSGGATQPRSKFTLAEFEEALQAFAMAFEGTDTSDMAAEFFDNPDAVRDLMLSLYADEPRTAGLLITGVGLGVVLVEARRDGR